MTIKKTTLTLAFMVIISTVIGQNKTFTFLPKWQMGETKKISIVQREVEYKAGKLKEDTTTYLTAQIEVLLETNDDYILKVLYENVALKTAINFYEKMGDELSDYNNLELQYKINKHTGKADLINWEEAQRFINQSFVQIDSLLNTKVPDAAEFSALIFAPIKEIFKSKENIESYVSDEIGYLLFPYDKKFVVGDTLTISTLCPNPLSPTDTINQITLSYLSNINESKKTCDIYKKDILDLADFKKMMIQMMESMGKSFGISDSSKNKAAKAIDGFDFDITNETVISFDYGRSWPFQVIKTAKVVATDPRGKSEKTVTTTATIK